ncbi:hypothetical protein VaNZ11_016295 [Volvox africanus]|uniref:Uncharacterized protein n=1 Tax=Volvox africanus TaxID=51714 RepID=A0ABQ5SMP0_9CHLO|nr:hypothetical protein VaNZ11_016295 [Volvox africanus]
MPTPLQPTAHDFPSQGIEDAPPTEFWAPPEVEHPSSPFNPPAPPSLLPTLPTSPSPPSPPHPSLLPANPTLNDHLAPFKPVSPLEPLSPVLPYPTNTPSQTQIVNSPPSTPSPSPMDPPLSPSPQLQSSDDLPTQPINSASLSFFTPPRPALPYPIELPSPPSPVPHTQPPAKPSKVPRWPPKPSRLSIPPSPSPPPSPRPSPPPPLPPGKALSIEVYLVIIDGFKGKKATIIQEFKSKAASYLGVKLSQIFITRLWIDGKDVSSGTQNHRRTLWQQQETVVTMSHGGDKEGLPWSWSRDELDAAFSSWDPYVRNLTHTHQILASDAVSLFLSAKESEAALFDFLGSAAAHDCPDGNSWAQRYSAADSSQWNVGRRLTQQAPEVPPIPITSEDGSVLSSIGSFAFEFIVVSFIDLPSPPSPPSPPLQPPKPPNLPGIINSPKTPEKPSSSPPPPYAPPGKILELSKQLGATRVFRVMRPPPTPPQPPLRPTSPPTPPPRVIYVSDMPALGAMGATRSLVWWDDPDFVSQLRPYKPLQLVDWNKRPCSVQNNNKCRSCTRAWLSRKASYTVSVFFREPVQLQTILIHQLKNPAVNLVRLLAWPFNLNVSDANSIIGNSDGDYQYLGPPVYDAITNGTDPTPCNGALNITIPFKLSGIKRPIPVWGSQSNLPIQLRSTAVAGVEVTVAMPTNPSQATVIESIRFTGRVLYPKNSDMYEQWTV